MMALDDPSRAARARHMFELMEEERVIGVEVYKGWRLSTDVKLEMRKIQKAEKEDNE